jgi:hypothetical protein
LGEKSKAKRTEQDGKTGYCPTTFNERSLIRFAEPSAGKAVKLQVQRVDPERAAAPPFSGPPLVTLDFFYSIVPVQLVQVPSSSTSRSPNVRFFRQLSHNMMREEFDSVDQEQRRAERTEIKVVVVVIKR